MKAFHSFLFLFFLASFTILPQQNWKKVKIFSDNLRSDFRLLENYDLHITEGTAGKDNSFSFFISDEDFAN
ncbi:MAG: hypothetical protein QY308_12430 [Ignavibacteriaceae bacterium]|nr:MAG: hypothetical protein QY308_12430 [Ignavibacteriaceae bacterium]